MVELDALWDNDGASTGKETGHSHILYAELDGKWLAYKARYTRKEPIQVWAGWI